MRALATDPADRPQSADEFRHLVGRRATSRGHRTGAERRDRDADGTAPAPIVRPEAPTVVQPAVPRPATRRGTVIAVLVASVVIGLAVGTIWSVARNGGSGGSGSSPDVPTTVPAPRWCRNRSKRRSSSSSTRSSREAPRARRGDRVGGAAVGVWDRRPVDDHRGCDRVAGPGRGRVARRSRTPSTRTPASCSTASTRAPRNLPDRVTSATGAPPPSATRSPRCAPRSTSYLATTTTTTTTTTAKPKPTPPTPPEDNGHGPGNDGKPGKGGKDD